MSRGGFIILALAVLLFALWAVSGDNPPWKRCQDQGGTYLTRSSICILPDGTFTYKY